MLFPVGEVVVWFFHKSLYSFAECGFLHEVFFFLSPEVVEILLVAFVHDCRSRLKAVPHFLSVFLSHWSSLPVFLMQLLQLS